MRATRPVEASPFLRWVGGKQRTVEKIAADLPSFDRYVEPMVGGGALFWHLQPKRALLCDANPLLVATWIAVRDTTDDVFHAYSAFVAADYDLVVARINRQVEIDKLRASAPDVQPMASERAATAGAFLALNRRAFNGLWRVNQKGQFNAPEDKSKRGKIGKLTPEFLAACSERLRGPPETRFHQLAEIRCASVFDVLDECGAGDFVYLDPPFLDQYGGYGGARWDVAMQSKLLASATAAATRGAHVRISNADSEQLRTLYEGHGIRTIETPRSVSCDGEKRKKVTELLVTVSGWKPGEGLVPDLRVVDASVEIPAGTLKAGDTLKVKATVAVKRPAPRVVETPPPGEPVAVGPPVKVELPAGAVAPKAEPPRVLSLLDAPFCPAPAPAPKRRRS